MKINIALALASIYLGLAFFSHLNAEGIPEEGIPEEGSPSPVPTPIPTPQPVVTPTPIPTQRPSGITSQELRLFMNHELDPTRSDRESLTVPESTTEQAVSSLGRTEGTHAGVTMAPTVPDSKDSKGLTVAPATEDGWFSEPTAYSDYKFTHVQDASPINGADGSQNGGTVGFDFVSFEKTIVGFNFTYSNEDLTFNSPGYNLADSSNSYFFSTYMAKNFSDWVNVGGSFTYGRSDIDFRSNFPSIGGAFEQSTRADAYSLSPFVGVSHSWGAFSFASTPTYIYNYNHYGFSTPYAQVVPGTGFPGSGRTINNTFLWINNFKYDVTDKFNLTALANWTRHASTEVVNAPGNTPISHGWMNFGLKADYHFNKDGDTYVQFDHDVFSTQTDDYRITGGLNYNF